MFEQVDFETALAQLKQSAKIKRVGWLVHLELSHAGNIYVVNAEDGTSAHWQPLDRDLLATDWIVAKETYNGRY